MTLLITESRNSFQYEEDFSLKRIHELRENILYLFSLGNISGLPVYYKQYNGSSPDLTEFNDIVKDCRIKTNNMCARHGHLL